MLTWTAQVSSSCNKSIFVALDVPFCLSLTNVVVNILCCTNLHRAHQAQTHPLHDFSFTVCDSGGGADVVDVDVAM